MMTKKSTLEHQPAHISSYLWIGWPSPKSPKYIAGPINSWLNARFIPHMAMGYKVPLGIVNTASAYLGRKLVKAYIHLACAKKAYVHWKHFTVKKTEHLDRCIHITGISLPWLNRLGRSIIARDVELEAMRNSSRDTLAKTERVSTDEVSTLSVWIVKSVEEKWSGWS